MRRLLTALLVAAGLSAFAISTMGAETTSLSQQSYWVEMDNAFGLIKGADVKVAGVRAGQISDLKIARDDYRALVKIDISARGFGDLREDVFCESRPQSLIGEYYLDCLPGTDPDKFPVGGTIPVSKTASTIPVDLVNNIMRRPYRERFSIILGELGAALTARGEDLNETIRRANPALRETDKVLKILGEQRIIIRDLTENADRVVGELAEKRKEVSRFIDEARDTSRASAERKVELEETIARLPAFFHELGETMPRLGAAAEAQTPAVQTLADNAQLLEKFFDTLGPFSEASRPAFRTLGEAGEVGQDAARLFRPRVAELRAFASDLPELMKNLAITLEHLDDRANATEKDPRSPGGQGYTGLEAILMYIFRQSQAVNLYDANSYMLKVSPFVDQNCAPYARAEEAKAASREHCHAWLGPNQPGITTPDPSKTGGEKKATRRKRSRSRDAEAQAPAAQQPAAGSEGSAPAGDLQEQLLTPELQELLQDLLPELDPAGGGGVSTDAPLFDFLFGR